MNIFRRTVLWAALLPCLASPAVQAHDDDSEDAAGAVYTMSNAVDGNKILAFSRADDGSLRPAGEYATGGLGSGAGLGNQNAVVLSKDGRWLFAVNAGSNQVSVFAVRRNGLVLVDTVDSGGVRPVSVTADRDVLYVLNAGSDNITGYQLNRRGKLTPLPASTRPLSGAGTGPAQISFSPDGDLLAVTEKATNRIDIYVVGEDGLATGPSVHASVGQTPFGFAFDRRGRLLVSEAAGGAFEASSVSSYTVTEDGGLQPISAAVPTTETAACWVVITGNGRYAYTTNAGSGSLAGYAIGRDGRLSLLNPDGRSGVTGAGSTPIDMAMSNNSRYLYTLNAGSDTVGAFRVEADGSLQALSGVSLPDGTNGLAAR
ncbi:MAG: beta-propeller fold lactonase family protein [Gammaproteobacteria bacterium]|nr:beta-propeller fold lactonase family protein [Gammaproteobacteria bacterium]